MGDSLSVFFLFLLALDRMLPSRSFGPAFGVHGDLRALLAGVLLLGVF